MLHRSALYVAQGPHRRFLLVLYPSTVKNSCPRYNLQTALNRGYVNERLNLDIRLPVFTTMERPFGVIGFGRTSYTRVVDKLG